MKRPTMEHSTARVSDTRFTSGDEMNDDSRQPSKRGHSPRDLEIILILTLGVRLLMYYTIL